MFLFLSWPCTFVQDQSWHYDCCTVLAYASRTIREWVPTASRFRKEVYMELSRAYWQVSLLVPFWRNAIQIKEQQISINRWTKRRKVSSGRGHGRKILPIEISAVITCEIDDLQVKTIPSSSETNVDPWDTPWWRNFRIKIVLHYCILPWYLPFLVHNEIYIHCIQRSIPQIRLLDFARMYRWRRRIIVQFAAVDHHEDGS